MTVPRYGRFSLIRRGRKRAAAIAAAAMPLALAVAAAVLVQGGVMEAVLGPSIDLASTAAGVTIYGGVGAGFSGDGIGRRIAIGNFNGDAYQDIALGVPRGDGVGDAKVDSGEVYVIFGSPFPPATRDLTAGEYNLVVYGAEAGDFLGFSVAAGNVNGDTIDDLIIGASTADGPLNARLDAGEVYVINGSLTLSGTKDIALGQQNLTIYGAEAGDALGRKAEAGDINGDGRDDIIATAPVADGPANLRLDAGEVYVVFGAAGLSGTKDIAAAQQNITVYGAESTDSIGSGVATGRINGDVFDDLLIGADGGDGPGNFRTDAGEAYLILGAAVPASSVDIAATQQNMTVLGADGGGGLPDNLGSDVAVGDVNGDSYGDLVITAKTADGPGNLRADAGELYVIYGSASPSGTKDVLSSQQNVTIYAAESLDEVSDVAVGNLAGDAKADIIFGADDAGGPLNARFRSGEAYIVTGSATLPASVDVAAAQQSTIVYAAESLDDGGNVVASVNFNGDSAGDLVMSAPAASGPANARYQAGEVYVFLGAGTPAPTPTPYPPGFVGGIAEMPDLATLPASAAHSRDAVPFAAALAALAGASVLVAAGMAWRRSRGRPTG